MANKKYRRMVASLCAALSLSLTATSVTGMIAVAEEVEAATESVPEAVSTCAEEAPQTEAPQTEAPQTEAPQTEAPQTEAPQTEAPQTEAPQTEAPQTEAPQTEAPQTEAPQTEAPQTEVTADGSSVEEKTANMAESENTEGDTPEGGNQEGDTPEGDTPEGGNQEGDTPEGDTPEGDTPEGDTPEGDDPEKEKDDKEKEEEEEKAPLEDAKISYSQNIAAPSIADTIRQTVSVTVSKDADTRLVYVPDSALTISALEVGSNTYLEGGTLKVNHSGGTAEVVLTATVDLSGYAGITSLEIIPKTTTLTTMTGTFTAVMTLDSDVDSFTCTTNVHQTNGEDTKENSSSYTSQVSHCTVTKPEISYDNSLVAFDGSVKVSLSGLGMNTYGVTSTYNYYLDTPKFAQMKSLSLPAMSGAGTITAYYTVDGKEIGLGTIAAGSTLEMNKSGVTQIRLEITVADGQKDITAEGPAVLTVVNNDKENKTNYHAFSALAMSENQGTVYDQKSALLGVTFELYKADITVDGNTTTPVYVPDPEPIPEPEKKEPTSTQKEAEKTKQQQIKTTALTNSVKARAISNATIASRIATIKGSALSSVRTVTVASSAGSSAAATAKTQVRSIVKEGTNDKWGVKPIREGIVSSLVPKN